MAPPKVSNDDIAVALYRLFWLVTQAPGVAIYADDVRYFSNMAIKAGIEDPEHVESLAKGYEEDESKRN